MDAANNTIHDRQSKTVNEDVNDAVINEQVRPHQQEEVTAAVDKDVHQDHHHTTVQPVKAQETLPEQHHQNVAPVQNRTVEHGNERDTRQALDREAAQFRNTSTTQQPTQSQSSATAPVENSERVHHHVHEHVQPVVEKETIQPHVVHTTVPVHETHHAEAIHHGTSVLPTKTLGELERGSGGGVGGVNGTGQDYGSGDDRRHHDHQHSSGQTVGEAGLGATRGTTAATHGQGHNGGRDVAARGVNDRGVGQTVSDERRTRQQEPQLGSSAVTAGGAGAGSGAGVAGADTAGAAQTAARTAHAKPHNTSSTTTTTGHSHSADAATSGKKPSVAAKLNPFKDADGDGHKGFMT